MARRKISLGGGFKTQLNIKVNMRVYLSKLMSRVSYPKFNLFADILSGLRIEEDPTIPTFCITVKEGYYLMKYSPEMVQHLDVYGAGIVIAHELGHATLGHVPRMLRLEELYKDAPEKLLKLRAVVHVAADYALNSWLVDTCKVFTLKDLKTRVGKPSEGDETFEGEPLSTYAGIHPSDSGLKSEKSMEWYITELAKKINSGNRSILEPGGSGGGDGDSSLQRALDNMTEEQLEELIKASGISEKGLLEDLLENGEVTPGGTEGETGTLSVEELASQLDRDAKNRLAKSLSNIKGRGSFKGDALVAWAEDHLAPPKIRWQDVLKSVTATAKPFNAVRSMRRPRRRGALLPGSSPFPGKVKDPSYTIVMAIDTSGSVSNSELMEIFSELDGLHKQPNTEILVVQCDTRIQAVYSYAGDTPTVYGRGGTEFYPVFDWLISGRGWDKTKPPKTVDLLIYATDGECKLPSDEYRFLPSTKVLWLLSSNGRVPNSSSYCGQRPEGVYGLCDYGYYLCIQDQ